MPKTTTTLFALMLMLLNACSGITPQDYAQKQPKLDIRTYLNGKVLAWGILQDRSDRVTRRFKVDMLGTWEGNKGVLQEYFTFDDGEKSERTWHIEFIDEHNFTANAQDTVGQASGSQYGNAMQMKYTLDLEVSPGTRYNVQLDDWMYLLDEKTLVNKSSIKKFGITFGKLTIFFQKQE